MIWGESMLIYSDVTKKIMDSAVEVYGILGYGFLEKVYANALIVEFRKRNIKYESQKKLTVEYKGQVVGDYVADLVVDNKVIVELKACEAITNAHLAQTLNYLKITNYRVGLIINFGPKIQFKRVIL